MCLLCGYGQAPCLHCFNSQNRDWFRQTAAYSAAVLRREHPGSPCSSLLDLMACWPDYREQLSNSHTSVAWFVACCSSSVIATRNAHQSLQPSNIIFWDTAMKRLQPGVSCWKHANLANQDLKAAIQKRSLRKAENHSPHMLSVPKVHHHSLHGKNQYSST